MVSFILDTIKFLLIYRDLWNIYWFKRGASSVTRSTNWGSRIARQVETSNAESPTPVYLYKKLSWQKPMKRLKPMRAVYNTPHEAFPLLCSWQLLFELPDSYTVKTKAYSYALYVYVCPTSAHRGFRYGYIHYKNNEFIRNISRMPLFYIQKSYRHTKLHDIYTDNFSVCTASGASLRRAIWDNPTCVYGAAVTLHLLLCISEQAFGGRTTDVGRPDNGRGQDG